MVPVRHRAQGHVDSGATVVRGAKRRCQLLARLDLDPLDERGRVSVAGAAVQGDGGPQGQWGAGVVARDGEGRGGDCVEIE